MRAKIVLDNNGRISLNFISIGKLKRATYVADKFILKIKKGFVVFNYILCQSLVQALYMYLTLRLLTTTL